MMATILRTLGLLGWSIHGLTDGYYINILLSALSSIVFLLWFVHAVERRCCIITYGELTWSDEVHQGVKVVLKAYHRWQRISLCLGSIIALNLIIQIVNEIYGALL